MKASALFSWRWALAAILALALVMAMLVASQGEADAGALAQHVIGVEVETETSALNADPGDKGDILIDLLVTKSRTQRPVSNVAASIPRNNAGITLPSRIGLATVTVAAGGCSVTPIQFTNAGNGVYTIRAVPFVDNASCNWLAGEYIFLVTVRGPGGAILGEGLAKLTV